MWLPHFGGRLAGCAVLSWRGAILFPVQGRIMQELTPSEVVALFGLDERRVRKDVEYGVFDTRKSPPRFGLAEIVYLLAIARAGVDLGVESRKRLYRTRYGSGTIAVPHGRDADGSAPAHRKEAVQRQHRPDAQRARE